MNIAENIVPSDMHDIENLLTDTSAFIDGHIEAISELLDNKEVIRLAESQQKHVANKVDLGFNIFTITSGLYHRENYHSDILCALLDPKGGHNEGNKFLNIFLKFLGLSIRDFKNAEVTREEGRIDIWIKGEKTAIIIENKINGAGDMDRQLPRYLEHVNKEGYQCVSIIYLSIDGKKTLDKTGWTEKDEDSLKEANLKQIAAYNEKGENNLYDKWIKPCEAKATNNDAICILNQYGKLINYLGYKNMNNIIIEDFYELIKDQSKFKSALAIRDFVDKLPEYMADKIYDVYQYKYSPFEEIVLDTKYPGFVFFLGYKTKGKNKSFRIQNSLNKICENYHLQFGEDDDFTGKDTEKLFSDPIFMKIRGKFKNEGGGWFGITFPFPDGESSLYKFLDEFLERLKEYKTKK